ncbi:hypothetical protein Lesp02_04430 [Lentzea sp. NBRC 105346]|uniref:glycosyltransferase family 39 protein n=1 Tax=Lentzea sp. NBRC 105346 TaxID=3032205 RepID=UPI0024A4CCF7|nr:glycosyltransferase family 39 protein [Lentzea sp. NBRC 105346]GLZ28253.1 hypothetical protein Lesp02_04430 [Lentzea sp. NBRC 105346]
MITRLATVPPPMLSVRRRLVASAREWLRRHRGDLAVLLPVLLAAGLVHAIGMSAFPRYVDDPGTYLSQAWSVRYQGTLSPYSYFYDHAPGGWIQIAMWAWLTDGFGRYDTAIGFGNEVMLLAKLASTVLLYTLGRRLGFSRPGAAAAGLLFALCPLAVMFGRWTFLDNLVTPWLLAAFVLALSPKRSIASATGGAVCFAMATLTKETALVLLPAFAWALWRNTDPHNRAHSLTVAAGAGFLLMAMYPLMAVYKGELFEGPGHNSLLGTAKWQLVDRAASGSLLNGGSVMRQMFTDWLAQDPVLLLGGLVSIVAGFLVRRLRPIALTLLIGWLMMLRGGYVPFMYVIVLLPWSALLIVGAIEAVWRRWPRAGVALAAVAVFGAALWPARLYPMVTASGPQPLRAAEQWVADNVPRDRVVVAHDSIWVDLVHQYGFQPRPIIVHKLDADPAVRRELKRVDYLVVPNWYYESGGGNYPTLLEARKHAVAAARFGSGGDGVVVYRVSEHWRP